MCKLAEWFMLFLRLTGSSTAFFLDREGAIHGEAMICSAGVPTRG